MERIYYSVDYASIIVYDSNFSTVYWPWKNDDYFCTAKMLISLRRWWGGPYIKPNNQVGFQSSIDFASSSIASAQLYSITT